MRRLRISPIVIVFVVCGFHTYFDNPVVAQEKQPKHLVPADKNLSQDAVINSKTAVSKSLGQKNCLYPKTKNSM